MMTLGRLLVLWLAFCAAIIVNRGPILFSDTSAYARVADAAAVTIGLGTSKWSDRLPLLKTGSNSDSHAVTARVERPTPIAGRSIYYGSVLWLMGVWATALLQALLGAVAVLLTIRRLGSNWPFVMFPLTIAISSASIFAAFVMPDFIAALAILSLAMVLSAWNDMEIGEKSFWGALLCFGALAHSATLLIVAAVTLTTFILWRRRLSFAPACAAIVVGIIGEIAFAGAVSHAISSPPLRPPFLSARLIDDGPGRAYLEEHCPNAGFALCEFYRELPDGSDPILWTQGGRGFISMTPDRQRRWSSEDFRFARTVLVDRPVDSSIAVLGAVGRQIVGFSVTDVTTPSVRADRIPADDFSRYQRTLVARDHFPSPLWDAAFYPLFLITFVLLFLSRKALTMIAKLVMLGVVFDIIICGALSTPHDRYLMRVVWLLPLMALTHAPGRVARQALGSTATLSGSRRTKVAEGLDESFTV